MSSFKCTGRKPCLKEVNPEDYPDVYTGEPWVFDPSCGECVDCHVEAELRERKED